MTVTWDAIQGVTSYEVMWFPASSDGTSSATAQGTSYTITNLNNLIEYTVSVDADTTLTCSTTVPTSFPQCPTGTLDVAVTAGDGHLTASWDAVSGVTTYELAWQPPATDDQSTAETQQTIYTILNLRPGVRHTIAVAAGADNACSVTGTPSGSSAESDPDDPEAAPAIPLAGVAALALLLAGGGHLRRRRPAPGA